MKSNRIRIFLASFFFTLILWLFPSTSLAAVSWHAYAGSGTGMGLIAASKFYPSTITIDEGDSITWTVQGDAHTVTFLSGAPAPSPLSSQAQQPSGGNTYDGSGFVNSGIVDPGGTYTLTFTKAGTYTYQCLLHPGMTATVVVQPTGTPYPQSQRSYTQQYMITRAHDIEQGVKLLSHAQPSPQFVVNADGTRTFASNAGLGNGTESIMRFYPQTIVLRQGDHITWTNHDPMMPHTVTFAGSDGQFPDIFTPTGGSTYDGTTFTSSGIMMPNASYTLTFTRPGRYPYLCLLHDMLGMKGTVIVLPRL